MYNMSFPPKIFFSSLAFNSWTIRYLDVVLFICTLFWFYWDFWIINLCVVSNLGNCFYLIHSELLYTLSSSPSRTSVTCGICARELVKAQQISKPTFLFVIFLLCTSILVELSVLIHRTKDFLLWHLIYSYTHLMNFLSQTFYFSSQEVPFAYFLNRFPFFLLIMFMFYFNFLSIFILLLLFCH